MVFIKKLILATVFVSFIFTIACNKSANNADNNCGCNTDSIKYTFINHEGILAFDSARNGWGIGVQFPTDDSYECKICNTNLDDVAAIIDTLPKKKSLPVIFSGKLKMLCSDEIDFYYLPENQRFDITIDSLQKN